MWLRFRVYEGTRVICSVPAQKVVPYYADSDAYYCISKAMPHPVAIVNDGTQQQRMVPLTCSTTPSWRLPVPPYMVPVPPVDYQCPIL